MVHEHVALSQHGEQIDWAVACGREARRGHRDPGRFVEIGAVDGVQRPELAQPERDAALVHVVGAELELGQEELAHGGGHLPVDLEPHGAAEATPAKLGLDGGEEVVGLALFEVEVGIARHPEGELPADLHVREEPRQVGRDQLLEGHEAAPAERDESRQQWRNLHASKALLSGGRVLDEHGEVERQVRDVGERMSRVDRERGEDREDVSLEDGQEPGLFLLVEVLEARKEDPRARETGHE